MATTDVEFGEAPFEIIDGDRGKNYPKQKDFLNSGHCLFLSATNVTKSGFVFADCLFIDEKKDSSLNKGKLRREDIVLTTRGTLGNTAYFKHTVLFENIRINSGMVILRCDREKILPVYLYHFLRSPSFHEQVNSLRSGVAQPQLPIRDMRRIKLPLPTMPEQKRISGILSAYDELIENSQQRIKILESMARALYREWFVHFRFPGHEKVTFVSSPLGKIPEGWEVKKLKNVCRLTMGQSPKSEFYNEMGEGQPFHQGVTNFGNRFPTDRLFCTVEGRIAEAGDILFSVRAPVGRMNIAGKKIIIGRGLSAIRHNYGHQAFLWEQLRNRFTKDDMMGNGAIFAAVTKSDMEGIELVCPPSLLIVAATTHFEPIHSEIGVLTNQIQNLRKTRDLLLPRLLSGQVELKPAEVAA